VRLFQEYEDMDVGDQLFMSAWGVSIIPHPYHVPRHGKFAMRHATYQWRGDTRRTSVMGETKERIATPITFTRISIENEIET